MKGTIMVVDRDQHAVDLVAEHLAGDGFAVLPAQSGEQAFAEARLGRLDLVILELTLPGEDSARLLRTLKVECQAPVIILSARRSDEDKLHGLELGADDYITKPFNPRELLARVHAVLRRTGGARSAAPVLQFAAVEIDVPQRRVWAHGRPVDVTPAEFDILAALALRPGRVLSRDQLVEYAFGHAYGGLARTADGHIMRLRRKIELDPSHPRLVVTVPGVGYRFEGRRASEPSATD